MSICARTKHRNFLVFSNRKSIVNNDIYPLEVFKEPENVNSLQSESMENWRVNSHRQRTGQLFVYNHIWIVLHASSATSEKLISWNNHRECWNEPAITKRSLLNIICSCAIIHKLWGFIWRAELFSRHPFNRIRLRVTRSWWLTTFVNWECITFSVLIIFRTKIIVYKLWNSFFLKAKVQSPSLS